MTGIFDQDTAKQSWSFLHDPLLEQFVQLPPGIFLIRELPYNIQIRKILEFSFRVDGFYVLKDGHD